MDLLNSMSDLDEKELLSINGGDDGADAFSFIVGGSVGVVLGFGGAAFVAGYAAYYYYNHFLRYQNPSGTSSAWNGSWGGETHYQYDYH